MTNLRTEEEWSNMGYEVLLKELSLHLDKHGHSLWRADQVVTPYIDPDAIEEENLPDE